FGAVIRGGIRRAGHLLEPLHVEQDAALVFERDVFAGFQARGFDFAALELPEIREPQPLLFGPLQLLQFDTYRAPLATKRAHARQEIARAGKGIEHVALCVLAEQKLLIVLAVDVRQDRRQLLEQRSGGGTAADISSRLAFGQNLALDQQFAILGFEAQRLKHLADCGVACNFKYACDPGAVRAAAYRVRRGAATEKQS